MICNFKAKQIASAHTSSESKQVQIYRNSHFVLTKSRKYLTRLESKYQFSIGGGRVNIGPYGTLLCILILWAIPYRGVRNYPRFFKAVLRIISDPSVLSVSVLTAHFKVLKLDANDEKCGTKLWTKGDKLHWKGLL